MLPGGELLVRILGEGLDGMLTDVWSNESCAGGGGIR